MAMEGKNKKDNHNKNQNFTDKKIFMRKTLKKI